MKDSLQNNRQKANIRYESPEDVAAIRHVNEEAFRDSDAANLIDDLRRAGKVDLSPPERVETSVRGTALAPLTVLPAFQNRGIGSSLVITGL